MKQPETLQLTERDRAVLRMVAAYGGLTTDHLYRRYWSTSAFPSACYGRIARLVDAGFLHSTRMAPLSGVGTGKAVLTLGRCGQQLLAADRGVRPVEIPRASPLTHPMTAAHHLAICDFRLGLELAAEAHPDVELLDWVTESELRRTPVKVMDTYAVLGNPARRQITLIPDGLFTLRFHGREQRGLLEMDLGTTSLPRLQVKLRGYLRWYQEQAIPLFLVTTSPGRAAAIAQAVASLAHELHANATLIYLATRQQIIDGAILSEPIWQQVGRPGPVALLPRADARAAS